jgi:hypothetical protein
MRAALWLQLQLAFNVVSDSPDYIKATFSRTRRRMQSRTVVQAPRTNVGRKREAAQKSAGRTAMRAQSCSPRHTPAMFVCALCYIFIDLRIRRKRDGGVEAGEFSGCCSPSLS